MKPTLRPVLLVIAAMFAFSMMAPFTRAADAGIIGISAWRAVFVAVVFAVWAAASDGVQRLVRPDRATLKLGAGLGLALALASSTFVGGYALTTVANTIFLHNLAPVVVFPLAWWMFRERPSPAALTGAAIAVVGVALMTGVSFFQVSHFANSRFLVGDGLALASALGYGAVLVLTRATRREKTPILSTLAIAWTIAAVVLVGVAVVAGDLAVPWSAVPWILGLAILCTNIPFYLLNLGMRSVGAGLAAVLSLAEVVFATALGILLYDEHLAPVGWIGGLLAALGVLYAITQDGRPAPVQGGFARLEDRTLGTRGLRAAVALVFVNSSVIGALTGWGPGAALVACAGLTTMARLGPQIGVQVLGGRFPRLLCWSGAATGIVALVVAITRGVDATATGDIYVGVSAAVFLLLDVALARREVSHERMPNRVVHLALILLLSAEGFAALTHPAATWLCVGAALTLGLSAAVAAAAGLRGVLHQGAAGVGPTALRVEGPLLARLSGRRLLAGLAAVWLLGGLRQIPMGHVAIVERFGAPTGTLKTPGLAVHIPPPVEALTVVDVATVRRSPLIDSSAAVLCGDQSIINLDAVLHYTVEDPTAYAYGLRDPEATLVALSRSALLEVMAKRSHDAALTDGRTELEEAIRTATQQAVDDVGLGFSIAGVHISSAAVPPPVVAAFLDVITADEERLTVINQAEAYAADLLPRAGGQAVTALAAAHGDAAQTLARAEGDATTFAAIAAGGAQARGLTRTRLLYERLEATLKPRPLVLAPGSVRVWVDGQSRTGARLPPPDPDAPDRRTP